MGVGVGVGRGKGVGCGKVEVRGRSEARSEMEWIVSRVTVRSSTESSFMRILASSAFVMIASAAALFWYTGAFQALSSIKLSVSLTDPDPPELPPTHREAPRQQLMAAHTGRAVRPRPRTLQVLRCEQFLTRSAKPKPPCQWTFAGTQCLLHTDNLIIPP